MSVPKCSQWNPVRGVDWDFFEIGENRWQAQADDEAGTMSHYEAVFAAKALGVKVDDDGNVLDSAAIAAYVR